MSRVYGSVWSSGTGGLGYNRWSSSMMYATFSALFIALRTDGFGRILGGQPQAEGRAVGG